MCNSRGRIGSDPGMKQSLSHVAAFSRTLTFPTRMTSMNSLWCGSRRDAKFTCKDIVIQPNF